MKSCKKLCNHLTASFLAIILMTVPALAAFEKTASDSVATVNGTPIPRERFNQEADRASQQFSQPGQPLPDEMKKLVQERVLDFLIGEELLHQKAVTKGISVSDQKVAEEISGVITKFGSEEKFKAALAQRNVSEAKVEQDIRRGLAIQELVNQEVVSKIAVSDEEIKQFYDDNRKLFTKQEASIATFEEVESQIADHLKQEKSRVAVKEYIETLKASATIETKI